jgi:hypothetical protein
LRRRKKRAEVQARDGGATTEACSSVPSSIQVDLENGGGLFLYPDSNSEHCSLNTDRPPKVQCGILLLYHDLNSERIGGSAQIWGGEVTRDISPDPGRRKKDKGLQWRGVLMRFACEEHPERARSVQARMPRRQQSHRRGGQGDG